MAWTIPDQGEGANDLQSVLFQEYLDVLVAGLCRLDCVLAGCAVTAQGSPDMTVAVAKGAVLANKILKGVSAGNVTIGTADATNPRLDLIVIDSSGAKQCRAGTAAVNPKPPARTANDVVLAVVYVPAADTTIAANQITDLRVMQECGPITIYKTTTAETTNTAATVELLNKANSGVTIPNGLFLAGRIIRVRLGGNLLLNSGTGTNSIAIRYGGTTMFSDTSAAQVADADRGAWFLEFDIVAQANNDQSVNGHFQYQDWQIARTAPGTGIGDMFGGTGTTEGPTAFSGAAAVDSDAADRLLSVLLTFASNASNEVVVEFATVEII